MIPALTLVLFALGLFQTGLTSVIQSVETVEEAVGEDALLSCQILKSEKVVQVTWQKQTMDDVTNLATSNTVSGSRVMSDFRGKVEVKDGGLHSRSIVIKNVTKEDEGCYLCHFITKPAGALPGRTCLRVYELHEPVLHVRESSSSDEFLVSCSATGRPAPTVTLNVTQQDFYLSQNQTVLINTNGTFTVTVTAVLAGFHDAGTLVGCAVQVLSRSKEAFVEIPDVKLTPPSGLTSVIQSVETVEEAVGEDALLSCQILQSEKVVHVTWQKQTLDGVTNLATSNTIFGSRVMSDFKGRVVVKDGGLHNSSIVIKNVTEEDEGCYLCLFITNPAGAFTGRTCLKVYELHEPVLHVRESSSTDEFLVSCSVTGRPAPTVTLNVTEQDFYLSQNQTVLINTNGTFTVTATAVLAGFHDAGRRVGCAVQVHSCRKEEFVEIPDVKVTPPSGLDEGSGSAAFIVMWIVVVTCLCAASVLAVLLIQKLRSRSFGPSHRDQEKTEVPQTADADTVQVPLFTPEKSSVRERTPHSKSQQRKETDPESSSTARRIQSDQVQVPLFTPEKSPVTKRTPHSKLMKNKQTDRQSSSTARRLDFDH
ncbi:butyrophilin-like protein 2 [Pleuronectes platessa]|uniref:butyrophilin-like protein 2 n=1 Tax=Pleuronectes platessa TaxID=8262 RepID=UPI00232A0A7A|nr:butyrophilin-like protein 2 [Pleuronectes platessa]